MTSTFLVAAILLPPAIFGIACLVSDFLAESRHRRWDAHTHQALRAARERHPARPEWAMVCSEPGCVVCERRRGVSE